MRMAIMIASAIASLAAMSAHAQGVFQTPRTSIGQPDLQGTWTNETMTRFERPLEMAGRLIMTAEEAAELDRRSEFRPAMRVNGEPRTSLITNPPDGRVPAMKPGAVSDPRYYTMKPGDGWEADPQSEQVMLEWPSGGASPRPLIPPSALFRRSLF